jgi:hypothetical protein
MKNLFNRLNDRQKKSVKIIAAMLIVAVVLFAVLHVLPKPKTNNLAKHETSTETSTSNKNDKKDDKKDNKQSEKKDSKKDDKKEDTSTTSETPVTNTTVVEQQNQTNSVVTNTPTTNTTPDPQPIYQTIHHEEVGHWETQVVAEAWDEPVYERKIIGNQTGRIYGSTAEFFNQDEDGSYHVGDVQVGTTHHDAVTQQVWVVDQYAWDETIIVGYR